MKPRILIATILACMIVLLALLRAYQLSQSSLASYQSGHFAPLTVVIPKGTWSYQPDTLSVASGDQFTITIKNDDDTPHGFAIDAYGVNITIPPHETRQTPTLLARESGNFDFYCSVTCGEGMVTIGTSSKVHRGHFDMVGKLIVALPPKQREN
jgi:plastocyanin